MHQAGGTASGLRWFYGKMRVSMERCRGAACRSRRSTGAINRLSLNWHAPIASVAALSERHAGWQWLRHKFSGARPPDLSLRGPEGAVAISGRQLRFRRWLSCDLVGYCEIATSACGLLAMTNLKACTLAENAWKPATAKGAHYPQGARRIRKAAKPPTAAQ